MRKKSKITTEKDSIEIDGKKYQLIIRGSPNLKQIKVGINNRLQIIIKKPKGLDSNFVKEYASLMFDLKGSIEKLNANKLYKPMDNIISLFGKEHKIEIVTHELKNDKYELGYKFVTFYLKDIESKEKLIRKLYKNECKKYVVGRTKELAKKYGFEFNSINIKWLVGSWGNCYKNKKALNFSSRLIAFPKEIIDYVIVHELCHLIHANHSNEFWKMVEKYYPSYKEAKEYMKKF